jgi:hypothetical protein
MTTPAPWVWPAVALGVGLGAVYLLWQKIGAPVKEVVDDAATAIGNAVVAATTDRVTVNAMAILPNGQKLDFTNLRLVDEGAGRFTFWYAERKYVLAPRRSDGLYPASPV